METYKESELILRPDGSIYHLGLRPDQVADTVIIVGDQYRVEVISNYFDHVEHKMQNREFVTHTGFYNHKRITVLSTGIGPDNIDIVINELDALKNIDFTTRKNQPEKKSIEIFRIGTSGALQEDIPVDSVVASAFSLGLDGLIHFYKNQNIIDKENTDRFIKESKWPSILNTPYIIPANQHLLNTFGEGFYKGVTITAPGFYAPQGRNLRLQSAFSDLNEKLEKFEIPPYKVRNFEMETSAFYGLAHLLGHKPLTLCVIIANRKRKEFSKNYKASVDKLIRQFLDQLV